MAGELVRGRLVLDGDPVPGRLAIEDGWIAAVEPDAGAVDGPLIAPGFIDVHVHGWGGHAATGDAAALSGMARALLRRGVTTFLPTAPSLPEDELPVFADRVRGWMPTAPDDGAQPLGFNLEGPFLSPERRGAHDPAVLRSPAELDDAAISALLDGLRVITIAPELPGALELISRLATRGIAASMGHSAATLDQARAGYAAGARTTTHLFNAMTGVDHRAPGLAVAALTEDHAYVELIADGNHVHPALWPIILRTKSAGRLVLVSDALPLAGMGDGRTVVGGMEVEVRGGRATLVGTTTLAGSVIALDTAVRNLVREGTSLAAAVAAASANPAALLRAPDRGRIEVGRRAHLVELDRRARGAARDPRPRLDRRRNLTPGPEERQPCLAVTGRLRRRSVGDGERQLPRATGPRRGLEVHRPAIREDVSDGLRAVGVLAQFKQVPGGLPAHALRDDVPDPAAAEVARCDPEVDDPLARAGRNPDRPVGRGAEIEDQAVRSGGIREDRGKDRPPGRLQPVHPHQVRAKVEAIRRDPVGGPKRPPQRRRNDQLARRAGHGGVRQRRGVEALVQRSRVHLERRPDGKLREPRVPGDLLCQRRADAQPVERVGCRAGHHEPIQDPGPHRRQRRERKLVEHHRRAVVGRRALRLRGRQDDQHGEEEPRSRGPPRPDRRARSRSSRRPPRRPGR